MIATPTPIMHRQCAWCRTDLGDVVCEAAMDGRTSHGIYPACVELNFPTFTAADATTPALGVAPVSRVQCGGGDPSFPVPVLAESSASVALRDSVDAIARGAHAFTVQADGPRGGETISSAIGANSDKSDEATGINGTPARPALD